MTSIFVWTYSNPSLKFLGSAEPFMSDRGRYIIPLFLYGDCIIVTDNSLFIRPASQVHFLLHFIALFFFLCSRQYLWLTKNCNVYYRHETCILLLHRYNKKSIIWKKVLQEKMINIPTYNIYSSFLWRCTQLYISNIIMNIVNKMYTFIIKINYIQ